MPVASKLRAGIQAVTPAPLWDKIKEYRDNFTDRESAAAYRAIAEKSGHKFGQIAFGPRLPTLKNGSVLPKICAELGWAVEPYSPERTTRLKIFWPRSEARFPTQPDGWINSRCTNIDKSFVAEAAAKAFGFSYVVDPSTYQGSMVCKGDRNAAHDGTVLRNPVRPEPGRFYMRYIDNVHGDYVQDIRVIFIGRILPIAYLKYRPVVSRFTNLNSRVEIINTSEVLTPAEITQLEETCRLVGMDYGEIDCLRDNGDGKLYAIDMNRTPSGPPNGLPDAECCRAIRIMAPIFADTFS